MTDAAPDAPIRRRPPATAAWPYRCFVVRPRAAGWKAENGLEFITADIPRSFVWTEREDREGLRTYIDLITAGRRSEALEFHDRGLVQEIEYDPEPVEGSIKVNFERFIDILAHRGHIDLPLKARLQFVGKEGRQLVPAEFITILARYVPNPEWFGDPSSWQWISRAEMDEIDPAGLTVSSAMYRGVPNMVDTAEDIANMEASGDTGESVPSIRRFRRRPPAPARESEISRRTYEKHFELLTLATPARGNPYFVRRLATYDGRQLWSGTSYSLEGPWSETTRNDAHLIALGVHP